MAADGVPIRVIIEAMPSTQPTWIDTSAALLTPLLALLAAYIAYQQYRVNKLHLRSELYERRLRVYKGVQVFLSEIVRDGDANYPRCSEFYAQASEAKFLFDDKVQNYVEDIYEQAINMHALQEQLYPSDGTVGLPVSDERSKVASDKTELMKWMVKQLPASKALFAVHMGVKQ